MTGLEGWFTHSPTAALRGSRDYFHSTDLYQEMIAGAKAAGLPITGPLEIKIRSKITCAPKFLFSADKDIPSADTVAALCSFRSGGEDCIAIVTEQGPPIIARKPYDEGAAASHSRIEGTLAQLTGPTGLMPIEAVTALSVHLHKMTYPPPTGKRWMLGQLTLQRPLRPSDSEDLEIKIEKNLSGTMTRSRVSGIDGTLGKLLFILS